MGNGKWEDRQAAGIRRGDKEPKECKDQKELNQSWMPSCTEQGVTMLQFNCFTCSKRERKKQDSVSTECANPSEPWQSCRQVFRETMLYLWGAGPAQGKTSPIAAVISTSSSLLRDGLETRAPRQPQRSFQSFGVSSKALPELLILVCVCV